ncbi:hypothetical protein [Prosthecomicrobium pneumaticum]|uniref:DUF5666 domain-containing protein n=1 Tax=Prosthecomicrobium pneumaticum TaxID=81895 RepID=A0A7W9FJZ1_9HYPH|nr:hypothetical protein [Prosthecomicrobium pneumaticum]MBB5752096.1 hypothetical protein [Prosthecomicrobium pneumaticum]
MKTLALAAASVAFLAAAGSAFAAQEAVGTVGSVNGSTLTLTNGQSFRVENRSAVIGFIPGDTVAVGYADEGSQKVALGVARFADPTKNDN